MTISSYYWKGALLFTVFLFSFTLTNYGYSVKFKTISDGLSDNTINCIVNGKDGGLWIGTENGLNFFDGSNFLVFNKRNGLGSNQISALACDKEGNIWVACTNAGLFFYSPISGIFSMVSLDKYRFNTNNITSILCSADGDIWIGTSTSNFAWLNTQKDEWTVFSFTKHVEDTPVEVISIVEGLDHSIWFATSYGIYRFFPASLILDYLNVDLNDKWISALFVDEKGNVKALISKYIYTIKPDGSTILDVWFKDKLDHTLIVTAVQIDPSGNIWVGSNFGVLKLSINQKEGYSIENISLTTDKQMGVTKSLFIHDGYLWIGTWFSGLFYMNIGECANQFMFYEPFGSHANNLDIILRCMVEYNGNIWVGTDWRGLYRIDQHSVAFTHYYHTENAKSIKENIITSLFVDSRNSLWIGTYGLMRYNSSSDNFDFFNIDLELPRNPDVNTIIELANNELLLCTSSGLYLFNTISLTAKRIDIDSQIDNSKIFAACMEDDEILWISTPYNVIRLNIKTKQFQRYEGNVSKTKSISNSTVKCIYIDRKKRIWVGTSDGLNLYNPFLDDFIVFDVRHGLQSNMIQAIEEDNNGNIWFSTHSGITKFRVNSFTEAAYKENRLAELFENYSSSDGLISSKFYSNSSCKFRNGELAFGGSNGITYFLPHRVTKCKGEVIPVLQDFRIFNSPVAIGPVKEGYLLQKHINYTDTITLSHNNSFLTFEYNVYNYAEPERVSYSYFLEGFDRDWHYVGNNRLATYTNINPGKYIFRVKASLDPLFRNVGEKQIVLIINPPWWKTWWFSLILVFSITSIFFGGYGYRINILKARQVILTRLVDQQTNELTISNKKLETQNQQIISQKNNVELKNKELEIKNDEIMRITNKLHESDQMKIRFYTNISHELITPLTLITSPLESMLQEKNLDQLHTNRLKIIHKNSNRLLRMVTQLLDFRKIDSESLDLHPEYHDVVLFIHNVYDSFKLRAEKKDIDFSFISVQKSYLTWFDPDMLDKILYNLLSNAFKFTPNGGKIRIELGWEDSAKSKNDKYPECIQIDISDSGIGIDKKFHSKIFERFCQIDDTNTRKYGGSGIGLALTKHLVEIHKGDISLQSEPGKGSCFSVRLATGEHLCKIAPDRDTNNSIVDNSDVSLESNIDLPVSQALDGTIVLIVEDNKDLRDFLRDELSSRYNIIEAEDGQTGYEMAVKHQPNIIISDVMMPCLDGFEMCQKIKLEWLTSHIPVVLLTAKIDDESLYRGLEIGADAYLKKPFQLRQLFMQVENLLLNRKILHKKFSNDTQLPQEISTLNESDKEFVRQLSESIENHIDDNQYGVEVLAQELNMSRSQLYKKTISLISVSAGELIRDMRLKKAARLLLEGKYNVSDIALMVGYNDRPQFTRSFINMFGVSPKKYQQNAK